MAAAGIYTIGGAFWEFGSPDWDRTKLFLMFGVAEDHDFQSPENGYRQAQEEWRAFRIGQSGQNRLLRHCRQLAWHHTPGTDGLLVSGADP